MNTPRRSPFAFGLLLLPFLAFFSHAVEEPTKVAPGPAQLIGKTFEECEKLLGKPTKSVDPDEKSRSFARHFDPKIPGIASIKLERVPEGSMTGPVPNTVNFVWYYFDEDKVSSQEQASKFVDVAKDSKGGTLVSVPTGNWMKGSDTLKMPEQYQHPKLNSLSFNSLMLKK